MRWLLSSHFMSHRHEVAEPGFKSSCYQDVRAHWDLELPSVGINGHSGLDRVIHMGGEVCAVKFMKKW